MIDNVKDARNVSMQPFTNMSTLALATVPGWPEVRPLRSEICTAA